MEASDTHGHDIPFFLFRVESGSQWEEKGEVCVYVWARLFVCAEKKIAYSIEIGWSSDAALREGRVKLIFYRLL